MYKLRLLLCVSAVTLISTFAFASEIDELVRKAKSMMREAAELAERGHVEEAAELKREAMGVLEQAKRRDRPMPPHHPEVMRLRERLESLGREAEELEDSDANEERLDDIRREAERVERELQELTHREHPHPEQPHGDIARRLEHMRIAADHLREAGLHDIAEHVAERAEATERELHEAHEHHHPEDIQHVLHEVMEQLDQVRREVGQLRKEMNELRRDR